MDTDTEAPAWDSTLGQTRLPSQWSIESFDGVEVLRTYELVRVLRVADLPNFPACRLAISADSAHPPDRSH